MNVEVTRGIKTYFIYIHTHTIDYTFKQFFL